MSTVLIADEDAVSRQLLSTLLSKWGFQVVAVSNGAEALHVLHEEPAPRLAILDWMMPELDGLQVIRSLRQTRPQPYTYVLMLTVKDRKEDILQGLHAGADDYLIKPFDAEELKARLHVGKRILDLQHRLMSALDIAEFRGTHDAITGVYNRHAILEVLQREVTRAQRESTPLALIMIDVDNFRLVNETYGHLLGDEVLKVLALRIKSVLRSYDWLGRCDGKEFMVIAPNCSSENGLAIAERIRVCIGTDDFMIGEAMVKITVSVGIAASDGHSTQAHTLLAAADTALSLAKSQTGIRRKGPRTGRYRPASAGASMAFLR